MNVSKLKDLRILAGRTEANVTALKISIDHYQPKQEEICQRVVNLQNLMREIREAIENLQEEKS